MADEDHLYKAIDQFIGRICIRRVAGGAGGSHVSLEFEPRVPRLKPLTHPSLSEEDRLTEAAYAIFVLCTWRLDSEDEVICGAWDDNSEGGPMLEGLDQLVGKKLEGFSLTEPGLDLELRFAGISFRIFCDNVNEVDMANNYSVFLPGEVITVATRSRIRREDTDESVE